MLRKNKWLAIVVIMVLMLFLFASVAGARGPANKATGSVWLEYENDGQNRYVVFDAHAPRNGEDYGKGSITWYQWNDDRELEEVTPSHQINVKYVEVCSGSQYAWFAAGPQPTRNNQWLVVKVYDGGTPATEGDEFSAIWVGTENDAKTMVKAKGDLYKAGGQPSVFDYNLVGGNLNVFYYVR